MKNNKIFEQICFTGEANSMNVENYMSIKMYNQGSNPNSRILRYV